MITIPAYPFFRVDKPEAVFGSPPDRYLPISKQDAGKLLQQLQHEEKMVDVLFSVGHLGDQELMQGRVWSLPEDVNPQDVRDTTAALLRSFSVSHEVKVATLAVAFHHWFPAVPA